MDTIKAVIEDASVHNIHDLFNRKPRGLMFNETDAVVVTALTQDGDRITDTFYFCLKPDGTFDEETIGKSRSQARRHRLASFIRYYEITQNVKEYNIKDKISEWNGRTVEVIPFEKEGSIYIP